MEESLTCDISSEENCVSTIETDNFWVKKDEFTAVMKNKSLREKRYFQNEWLGLRYHLQKRSAFCTVCTDYAQLMTRLLLSIALMMMDLRTGKKKKKSCLIMQGADSIKTRQRMRNTFVPVKR